MKSIIRFHSRNRKQQRPIENLLLAGEIIALGVLLLISSSVPVLGLHRETALLKKYSSVEGLVNDIKNGKVDFKDFRKSDGISLAVMQDSEIYKEAGAAMQNCIDLAGKIGHSLGDREIVHCAEDSNYFKNKYNSNITVPASVAPSIASTTAPDIRADSMSTDGNIKKNALIEELVRTGKFTDIEAKEFADKVMPLETKITGAQVTPTTGGQSAIANPDTRDDLQGKNENSTDDSRPDSGNPEDYDDLSLLVVDIKNGKVDRNEISLSDFQISGAYARADRQTQDCIDLAGKIGHNLGDHEIVRCSENANYFKDKYSS